MLENDVPFNALSIFLPEHRRDTSVKGSILKVKSLAIHRKIEKGDEFVASDDWLNHWKKQRKTSFTHAREGKNVD